MNSPAPQGLPLIDHDPNYTPLSAGNAIIQIGLELSQPNSPSGFLVAADRRLAAASDELIANLGTNAIRFARSDGATVVDVNHVNQAYVKMQPQSGVIVKTCGWASFRRPPRSLSWGRVRRVCLSRRWRRHGPVSPGAVR